MASKGTAKITEKDNGWKALNKVLRKLGNKKVVVGIPGKFDFSVPTSAAIGLVHEFGSPSRGIPARSFLRSTFDKNVNKYTKLLESYVEKSVRDLKVADRALFVVGETARGDVINSIRNREIPQGIKKATKLAFIPGTKTRRGDSPALMATGNTIVQKIVSKVVKA